MLVLLPFNIKSVLDLGFLISDSDYTLTILAVCMCQTLEIIIVSLVLVSILTLAAISVDGLICINKWPFQYQNQVRQVIIILSVVWMIFVMATLTTVFGFGEIRFSNSIAAYIPFSRDKTPVSANIYFFSFRDFLASCPVALSVVANLYKTI